MIDLDLMDERLDRALTLAVPPASPRDQSAPVPAPTPAPARAAALEARATSGDRSEVLTWSVMRALLDGRPEAVRGGLDELSSVLGPEADQVWVQRFWAAIEWGTGQERQDVLDHCRARAYRYDDVAWWGNLTLLLATLGKDDEAFRAFDVTVELVQRIAHDPMWLDVVTNLVEAASLLGDPARMAPLLRWLSRVPDQLVDVGPGLVCKGSLDRYRGLAFAGVGRPAEASACFRRAEDVHRSIGAATLLDRALHQAERVLQAA